MHHYKGHEVVRLTLSIYACYERVQARCFKINCTSKLHVLHHLLLSSLLRTIVRCETAKPTADDVFHESQYCHNDPRGLAHSDALNIVDPDNVPVRGTLLTRMPLSAEHAASTPKQQLTQPNSDEHGDV